MLRKILLSIASVFLMWQSYSLISIVHSLQFDAPIWTILLAAVFNLFITGIFAFSGFAFPTQNLLPDSYYRIRQPKKLKKVYTLLQVNLFRTFLLKTFWKNKQQQKNYFNGQKNGLTQFNIASKKSEFGHLLPFVILCLLSIYFAVLTFYLLALLTFIINIIFNFYPIILQRHHRMRIQLLKRRYGR